MKRKGSGRKVVWKWQSSDGVLQSFKNMVCEEQNACVEVGGRGQLVPSVPKGYCLWSCNSWEKVQLWQVDIEKSMCSCWKRAGLQLVMCVCHHLLWGQMIAMWSAEVKASLGSIKQLHIYITVHRNRFLFNNQPDALIVQIYSVTKLYMFWATSLPIIRSSLVYNQHW
jgi:hypothetical protein